MARIAGIDLPKDKRIEVGLNIHLRDWNIKIS
jgi:ribosomal protein S13